MLMKVHAGITGQTLCSKGLQRVSEKNYTGMKLEVFFFIQLVMVFAVDRSSPPLPEQRATILHFSYMASHQLKL